MRLVLGLAQPAGRARFVQKLLLALEAEFVPVEVMLFGVAASVADDLPVALGEQGDSRLGNVGDDDRLFVGVKAGSDPEVAQPLGELGLEIGAIFMDLVLGQRPRVDRADAAAVRDDEVRNEIVQMIVRIAGDRGIDQIGPAVRAVLDGERRPRRVMGEGDPAELAAVGAFFAGVALARHSEILRRVAQRLVVGEMDGVADQRPLGLGRGEFGGERDRFMRREDEVEAGVLARMRAPGRAIVGAAGLEQRIELVVPRFLPEILYAERGGDFGRHVGPPARPLAPSCVIGGQLFAGLEIAAVRRDAADLQRLGLRLVLRKIGADLRAVGLGGDLAEIEHVRRAQARRARHARGRAVRGG